MHRIDHATRKVDANGPGRDGFTEGTPGVEPATVVTADWANAVQEEIARAIEARGMALNKADNGQLAAALATPLTTLEGQVAEITSRIVDDEWTYPIPGKGRALYILPSALTPVGDATAKWIVMGADNMNAITNKSLSDDRAVSVIQLNRLVPANAQIMSIIAYVTPGAARAATGARVGINLYVRSMSGTFPFPNPSTLVGSGVDDGTTNPQDIQIIPLPDFSEINLRTHMWWVSVVSGLGDTANDTLHGLIVDFQDWGPVNF